MDDAIDLDALRASIRDVLDTECSRDIVLKHAAARHGMLQPLWRTATELGWTALSIPDADGGLGLGIAALAPLYEELGRAVAPLPFLPTMLAADAIRLCGDDAQRSAWLPRIAAGAVASISAPAPLGDALFRIEHDGDDIILTGEDRHLLDGADAAFIVLFARAADGSSYRVIVEPDADAIDVARLKTWDHGHSLGSVALVSQRLPAARAMSTSLECEAALTDHAALALASEAVGGSEALLDLTIDYLKTRNQFGKPIGSFQALKHRIADHRTRLEGDRLLVRSAARLAAAGDPGARAEASAAKAQACGNYAGLARDAIQLHGGIGFTAEHPCHLFLKRARLNEGLFGSRELHLARAFQAILAEKAA